MDYSPQPRLALRAMTSSAVENRFANVRFGMLPRSPGSAFGGPGMTAWNGVRLAAPE